ncbi:glutaredoxin-like protein C5orf63 homolog [Hydra vulgaris]|uniref:Glutaredoxin-like protein n=1 Tax=Hydra vulgaris TaxID=6087 RepID=A0ABM4DC35_HYDVU
MIKINKSSTVTQIKWHQVSYSLLRCFCSFKPLPVVTLYSKAENCSLCDEAKRELKKFEGMFVLEEIDITAAGNQTWFEKYKYEIPVIHLNGKEIMRHKVFKKVLIDALDILKNKSQ